MIHRPARTSAHTYVAAELTLNPRTCAARHWGLVAKGARYLVGLPEAYMTFLDIKSAVQAHQVLTDSRAMIVRVYWSRHAPMWSDWFSTIGHISTDATLPGWQTTDEHNRTTPRQPRQGTFRRPDYHGRRIKEIE